MSKFFGMLAMVTALVLVTGAGAAQDADKEKRKGKGKGNLGNPETSFKKLDANSDGKLTREEFLKMADKVQDANRAEKFKGLLTKAFDKLSEGKDSVSLEQFKKFGQGRGKGAGKGAGNSEEAFKKLDANSDGKLTKAEYLKIADRVQDAARAEKVRANLTQRFEKLSEGKESITLEQFKKGAELNKRKKKSAGSQ